MRIGTAARAAMTLALALGVGACTVPEVDLAGKACDAEHPCTDGFLCVESICVAPGAVGPDAGPPAECAAGDSRPCGESEGECRQGTQSCGGDGRFGACVGAVGPADEVCNGKDDDCDGEVDDEVAGSPCELSLGVCAEVRHRCVEGAEPACGALEYGADYEANETRCDGKDNDCDGKVDEALDEDRDGFGPAGVNCPGTDDCDDHDADVHPGLPEDCDGKDNDCDGEADVPAFACARGEVSGSCQVCAGTAGQNTCKADCSAFACVPPPEQCNGLDDNCDSRVDEGLSGNIGTLGGGAGAGSPTVAAQRGGGFNVGYVYSSGPSTLAALQAVSPSAALQDMVRLTDGTAPVSSPAVSPLHFAWIESPNGSARVRAVELTPQGSPSEPFTAMDTYPDVADLAASEFGSATVLAGVTGAGASLVVATINGTSVRALNAAPSPSGVTVSRPAFGTTVADQTALYYERADSGMRTLGARVLDAGGVPASTEAVFTVPSDMSLSSPSGAPRALAFVQAEGAAASRVEGMMLARMANANGLGAATLLRLSPPTRKAAAPAVAWLRSGADDVYFVAWLDSDGVAAPIVNTVRVRWDAANSVWGRVSTPTGFQQAGRNIQSIAAAGDGLRFAALYDSEASGSFQTVLRNVCPAGAP